VLAVPYLAGAFGGIVTVRITPTPVLEAAPLWGFIAGAAAGAALGLTAAFSGGPLGDGRLAVVGPSGWQVALVAVLEIGVTAALTAAATNWFILRPKRARGPRGYGGAGSPPVIGGIPGGRPPGASTVPPGVTDDADTVPIPVLVMPGTVDETDDADGHRIYLNPWIAWEQEEPDEG